LIEWNKTGGRSFNYVINHCTEASWPPIGSLHANECNTQARLRSALVGLACERYRLKCRHWPETLDVVVKEKLLDSVPGDPTDNKPLRYRRQADGIIIYSIGPYSTDNEAQWTHDPFHDPREDLGFRLWDASARGQP